MRWTLPGSMVAIVLLCPAASAKPAHKQAIAKHFGPLLTEKLNACVLCHVPGKDDDEEKPRNPFGGQLETVRKELRDSGQPTDIVARFTAIADRDADADGATNLVEILTGHFPAGGKDRPTADEIRGADAKLTKYRKMLSAYPWKPLVTVKRPAVPPVALTTAGADAEWGRHPIDAFVAAELAEAGIRPRPLADRRTLIRRVTLDLTGLPPTEDEIRSFLADSSENAYVTLVDRLLASPRYGERWGRHWMDVWRYSDAAGWSDGNQIRDSQPHVWRWRDWIVERLNADAGYDRMIVEMLAGDELAPDNPDVLRATGYLVRNFKSDREKWLQDTVDHTFLAFQAMTVGCARCHDHMYDPIPQKEYYQLRAIFEPHRVRLDRVPGETDTAKNGLARSYDADLKVATYLYHRGDDRNPDKSSALTPGTLKAYGPALPAVVPVKLPSDAFHPDRREFVLQDDRSKLAGAVAAAKAALGSAKPEAKPLAELEVAIAEGALASFDAVLVADRADEAKKEAAAKAAVVVQRKLKVLQAKKTVLLAETAKANDPKKVADAKAALAKAEQLAAMPPDTTYAKRNETAYPPESSGRRLALAKWLTDPGNPLTARVAVNHIWLRHFGQAIVPSVFDFGNNGRAPSHPALLDWLAAELVAQKWSMKAIHRQIVLSRTYRSASTPDSAGLAADPDNRTLWRFAPRRLEAEAVRDQLLFAARHLDPTMGGPELDQKQGFAIPRRSLYFRHAHERQMEFLKLFDAASVTECYQRRDSIAPQQALALSNSPLAMDCAKRVSASIPATSMVWQSDFVTSAFERILGREPTEAELAECRSFLDSGTSARQKELLILALFSHHDFVTLR
jgi:Protein of unknown function (DUF1553)/Protein of unknown function (DUF1549)